MVAAQPSDIAHDRPFVEHIDEMAAHELGPAEDKHPHGGQEEEVGEQALCCWWPSGAGGQVSDGGL